MAVTVDPGDAIGLRHGVVGVVEPMKRSDMRLTP